MLVEEWAGGPMDRQARLTCSDKVIVAGEDARSVWIDAFGWLFREAEDGGGVGVLFGVGHASPFFALGESFALVLVFATVQWGRKDGG